MTTTADLAQAAAALHAEALHGSLNRKAAGCARVVLNDARTIEGAKRMLQQVDIDTAVKKAALDLIDQLTEETTQR